MVHEHVHNYVTVYIYVRYTGQYKLLCFISFKFIVFMVLITGQYSVLYIFSENCLKIVSLFFSTSKNIRGPSKAAYS